MILKEIKILVLSSGLSLSISPLLATESNCAVVIWGSSRGQMEKPQRTHGLHHIPDSTSPDPLALPPNHTPSSQSPSWSVDVIGGLLAISTTLRFPPHQTSWEEFWSLGCKCVLCCSVGGVWLPNLCAFVVLVCKKTSLWPYPQRTRETATGLHCPNFMKPVRHQESMYTAPCLRKYSSSGHKWPWDNCNDWFPVWAGWAEIWSAMHCAYGCHLVWLGAVNK